MLHSIYQQIWKTQQWLQDWKNSVFITIPKKGKAKECSNYHTTALISHASKVKLKILQARLQEYVKCELPDVQAGFRKCRVTRYQIANICWIIKKAREFQRNIYFYCIDYAKAFHCVHHNKRWKILQEMGIPDDQDLPPEKSVAGQEATVRTGHRITDWFQIGKGVHQGCILSPCLFNIYASCTSPTPEFHPNPCPLNPWSHQIILSSVVPFSSCPQSFPAIRVFQWVSSLH